MCPETSSYGWIKFTGSRHKDLCRRHGFSEASYYLWRS
ncbi:transposase, partial [Xanthomonas phaseoli]